MGTLPNQNKRFGLVSVLVFLAFLHKDLGWHAKVTPTCGRFEIPTRQAGLFGVLRALTVAYR